MRPWGAFVERLARPLKLSLRIRPLPGGEATGEGQMLGVFCADPAPGALAPGRAAAGQRRPDRWALLGRRPAPLPPRVFHQLQLGEIRGVFLEDQSMAFVH